MQLAPFKAIRPKPQYIQGWVNRQIDDYFENLTREIDLFPPKCTYIKPKPLLGMLIFDFLLQ